MSRAVADARLRRLLAGSALALAGSTVVAAQDYTLATIGPPPCREAIPLLKAGVDAGEAEAMYTTAQMVIRRVCYVRDYEVYARLLRQAADRGHRQAMRDLGDAYGRGDGVQQDYALAGRWFREGGLDGQKEFDDYTLGWTWTLARRVMARTSISGRQWLTRRHVVDVLLVVVPDRQEVSLEMRPRDPKPGDAEQSTLMRLLDDRWPDGLERARKEMASVPPGRLSPGRFEHRWALSFSADLATAEKSPEPATFQQAQPR